MTTEKNIRFDEIHSAALACTACPLAVTRKQVVFARGDPAAKLWLIGEGPGADEDEQGMPFVGRAGQLLDKILAAATINQDEVFITNTVLCRPPGNRVPTDEEITACSVHRNALLDLWKPPLVVLVGGTAARVFLGGSRLADMRGQRVERDRRVYYATFHPAYLLRDPSKKALAWQDWQKIRDELRSLPRPDNPLGKSETQKLDRSVTKRLMPYIEQTVTTPRGTGRLIQVFNDRCGVVLDHDPRKVAFFHPSEITEFIDERQAG